MKILFIQAEELNSDGQVIKSKCVCEVCGEIFANGSEKKRHVEGGYVRSTDAWRLIMGKIVTNLK